MFLVHYPKQWENFNILWSEHFVLKEVLFFGKSQRLQNQVFIELISKVIDVFGMDIGIAHQTQNSTLSHMTVPRWNSWRKQTGLRSMCSTTRVSLVLFKIPKCKVTYDSYLIWLILIKNIVSTCYTCLLCLIFFTRLSKVVFFVMHQNLQNWYSKKP